LISGSEDLKAGMNAVIRNIVITGVLAATVALVKLFLIDSYSIKSDEMCETLKTGDYVLVNKLKSKNNPGSNRLVLYKSPLRQDANRPPLFLGRCLGMPGELIQMSEEGFRVNGHLLEDAPMVQSLFRIRKDIKENLLNTMELLHIPLRDVKEDSLFLTFRLSLREKKSLSENLSNVANIEMLDGYRGGYEFVIPQKNLTLDMNPVTLTICREVIMREAGDAAVIKNDKLYINGEEKNYFFFRHNYYWMASENEKDGIDSRHLGLVPEDHIIGNVWFCWFSRDSERFFHKIK
jgi:signal peptidase I